MPSSDPRLAQLHAWLLQTAPALDLASLRPASSDASFRRYFRVTGRVEGAAAGHDSHDDSTYIVMDAPPPQEDVRPFVAVAHLFAQAQVAVPVILAQDEAQGFLLLTDLGSTTYLDQLRQEKLADANSPVVNQLYLNAIDALQAIQQQSRPHVLPIYDRVLLQKEMDLFAEWYIAAHLQIELNALQKQALQTIYETLLADNLAQPAVFVHRDYHSRNLMVLAQNNPGILDFQDAVYGPITYDLVSLLRDAYIEWEEERVLDWVIRYWEKARRAGLPVPADIDTFYRQFEWMGLQRQLKVLGIFARLNYRDGKPGYLHDLPRVLSYARKTALRYAQLKPLAQLFDTLENKSKGVLLSF